MGSMVCNRIDLNGVGALRGQRHIPSKMGGGGGDTNVRLPTWTLKAVETDRELGRAAKYRRSLC